jgi:hypothetical protein
VKAAQPATCPAAHPCTTAAAAALTILVALLISKFVFIALYNNTSVVIAVPYLGF